MKKLLTTLFAVFVVVSAFATVHVQTITPPVNYRGACERVGTMKFIVTNDQDYQNVTNDTYVLIRVQLTAGATLCHNIFSDDSGAPRWGTLEVDGNMWHDADAIRAYGKAGASSFYILVTKAPGNGGNLPAPTPSDRQAWFIIGNDQAVGGGLGLDPGLDPADPSDDGSVICVNFQGSTIQIGDFFVVGITDYTVSGLDLANLPDPETMSIHQYGTSYEPANPAIALAGSATSHNFTFDWTCGKNGHTPTSDDVLLCQCYTSHTQGQNQTTYECHETYRIGRLVLNDSGCQAFIKEDSQGMLPANSVITFSVVDSNGNPIDVFFVNAPTLTTDGTSGLTLSGGTYGILHDAAGSDAYSDMNCTSCDNALTNPCPGDYDECHDYYDLYETVSYTVTHPSDHGAGTIYLEDFYLARLTSDGPVEAYLMVSWAPKRCGTGNSLIIPVPLKFVACPDEQQQPPVYAQASLYFPYFPATNGWWSGLAITNVNYYYNTILPNVVSYTVDQSLGDFLVYNIDQDINITLYLIEADGDVYVYDAGTLPKSGILTVLLSDPSFSPVLMNGYTDDAFGDERFWVVAVGTATIPETPIVLDGFGMLGDGTQAQGFLPRIPTWLEDVVGYYYGYLNNKN